MSAQIAFANSQAKKKAAANAKNNSKAAATTVESKDKTSSPTDVTKQVILNSYKDYPQWIETSGICMTPKYGALTTVYKTFKNYEPEEPEAPLDYRGAAKDKYIAELDAWNKEKLDIKKKAPLFFGDILLTISKGAMEKLKQNRPHLDNSSSVGSSTATTTRKKGPDGQPLSEWDEIRLSLDPERLIKRIVKYFSRIMTHNKQSDDIAILKDFLAFKQSNNMSVDNYYQTFRLKALALESTENKLSEETIAANFLNNAHPKYGEFILNHETTGTDLPDTVIDVKELLEEWDQQLTDRPDRHITSRVGRVTSTGATFITNGETTNFNKPTNPSNKIKPNRSTGKRDNTSKANSSNGNGNSSNNTPVTYDFPIDNTTVSKRCNRPCQWCGGPHWASDCKRPGEAARQLRERSTALVSTSTTHSGINLCTILSNSTSGSDIPDDIIIWDTATNADLFNNSSLLSNIRESGNHIQFTGVGGKFTSSMIGDTQHFGTVHYHPNAPANILSQSIRIPAYNVIFDNDRNQYYVTTPEQMLFVFSHDSMGMYSYKPSQYSNALVATVRDNKQYYSKREIERANKVKLYERRLGYPSTTAFRAAIHDGVILNLPITTTDLDNSLDIYGHTVAGLKGRTKYRADRSVLIEKSIFTKLVQTIHMDLFFVFGVPFALAVCKPMNLLLGYMLVDGRGAASAMLGIDSMLSILSRNMYTVCDLYIDGEKAVEAITEALASKGISVNRVSKGQHVAIAETMISTIKEHIRSIVHSLPYRINSAILAGLVYYAIQRINMLPSSTSKSKVSPREMLIGRKTDALTDVRHEYGEYIQVYDAPKRSNSMEPRTIGAIALHGTNNHQGSIYAYALATGEIISRSRWKSLPIPEEVVVLMNQRSDSPKYAVKMDPEIMIRITAAAFANPAATIPEAVTDVTYVSDNSIVSPHYDNQDPNPPDATADTIANSFTPEQPVFTVDYSSDSDEDPDDDDEPDSTGPVSPQPTYASLDSTGPVSPRPTSTTRIHNTATIPHIDQSTREYDNNDITEDVAEDPLLLPTSHKQHPERSMRTRAMTNAEGATGKAYTAFHMSVKKSIQLFGDKAIAAMEKELYSMVTKKVLYPIRIEDLSREQLVNRVVRTTMFLREKLTPEGLVDLIKARLVALGNFQDRSLYRENDISSPTASITSLFIILSIAAYEGYHIMTDDIGTAYLNANLPPGQLYLILDPFISKMIIKLDSSFASFVNKKGEIVCEARKALYGSLEAGKLWYNMMRSVLMTELDFLQNPYDQCVFWRDCTTYGKCIILLFVDDLLICAAKESCLDAIHNHLVDKFKEVKSTKGKVHSFLGVSLDFQTEGEVSLHMEGYIREMLKCYNVTRKAKTPARNDLFTMDDDSPLLDEEDKAAYYSATYKLLYVGKRTRPEILLAVNFLTTRARSPTVQDRGKLYRVLEYLNSDPALPMILRVGDEFQLYTFADASHAIHRDMKGHNGVIIQLGDACVFHKSCKQKMNCKSSTEAELVNLSDSVPMTIWCNNFIRELGYEMPPVFMLQDNVSTITMVNKGTHIGESTRHIDIRFFYIHDYIEKGLIITGHCPTDCMSADGHSKPTQGAQFTYCSNEMLGRSRRTNK